MDPEDSIAQIRDIIARLRSTIQDLAALQSLLAAPLHSLGILPPRFTRHNTSKLPQGSIDIARHIPAIQLAIIEHVIPTWEPILVDNGSYALVEQYFCPDSFSFATPAAVQIAAHAYSTILSIPLTDYSIRLLSRLSLSYPIDVLERCVSSNPTGSSRRYLITWEDCVRNVASIPGKVSNALAGKEVPSELESGPYFDNVSVRCECMIWALAAKYSKSGVAHVVDLLTKLVKIGAFPPSPPVVPSQPSFFRATLPTIRRHRASETYSSVWSEVISSIGSALALRTILTSLFSHLSLVSDLDDSEKTRGVVKREAQLLRSLFGRPSKDSTVWDSTQAIIAAREWSIGHARIMACWIAGGESIDRELLEFTLDILTQLWTNPEHVKHSLLSRHHSVTAFLLIILSYLSSPSAKSTAVNSLALSPSFVAGVSVYLSHLDPSIRRCGMLVAEEVARGAGKKLDFADWDGDEDGKAWCRSLRAFIQKTDGDVEIAADSDTEDGEVTPPEEKPVSSAISETIVTPGDNSGKVTVESLTNTGYDSDDSLTGYISNPSSSRSPSPSSSELEEIERDPTLRVGQQKVAKPVYLAQLGQMIKPSRGLNSNTDEGEVKRIEVALDSAEELVRRKRNYGTELEENAVDLVHSFIGLQDNFDLPNFSEKRQATVNALVACCPRKSAPTIIEAFFSHQYSSEHRYVMLNALALGARELASLPLPPTATMDPAKIQRISFPSKQLPGVQHQRYLQAGNQRQPILAPVRNLLEGISREAIDRGKEAVEDKVPQIARERQLRLKKPSKVTEIPPSSLNPLSRLQQPIYNASSTTFTDVAAEFFICPLINRFWLFLRDEQTREERSAHQPALHRYRGGGTGLILNPLVLSHFLGTLAVLVHASRNAKEWLAIIAPDAMELAVTLGTRPLSLSENGDSDDDNEGEEDGKAASSQGKGKDASVLTTSLELVLIVLDGCVDLDGGRSISMENTAMVVGAGQWAEEILTQLEKGARVSGGGGVQEMKLRRAAAGVVLKVEEVTSKWRRSMIDLLASSDFH